MPEGSARRVFERVGADPDKFHEAIGRQYSDALKSVGIDVESIDNEPEPIETERMFHNSKPSGQAVMKELYALKKKDKDRPLLGAHVVGVVASMEHGVAARAIFGVRVKTLLLLTKERYTHSNKTIIKDEQWPGYPEFVYPAYPNT